MQLLLSINETVTIGSIEINVLEVRHDSVKLGINNPNAIPAYQEAVLHLPSNDDDDDGFEPECESAEYSQANRFVFSLL